METSSDCYGLVDCKTTEVSELADINTTSKALTNLAQSILLTLHELKLMAVNVLLPP